MKINYQEVGLKVGLECHQQLATQQKLFCSCKPELFKNEPEITFLRRLRPTQSELGQIDPAAFFEFQKGVKILYEMNRETSCLVEMDEEPPHELNREALDISLILSLLMNAKPVNEVHVMRKSVIDGSNTTGFQRTCVVAMYGEIEVERKKIPIQHISLEEDAARKTGENGFLIHYRIDRLGVPLVEVTTGPVIYSPEETEKVALAVGRILRSTKRVKRGLGTIRQDLNISIRDGALIEIKGVQELELVAKVVEQEVQRQISLLRMREELRKRGLQDKEITETILDVTNVFARTNCQVIQKALNQNKKVLAAKLPKFAGLLGTELIPGLRLGTEMADRARFWGKVGGILHTDELLSYGTSEEEINKLRNLFNAEPEDGIVTVADVEANASDALRAVIDRAREALKGVPEETRAANPDGSSRYMRPRPGAARMYPETDVPPIVITQEHLDELHSALPEPPESKAERLIQEYAINQKLAKQLIDSEYENLFEDAVKQTHVSPTVAAVTLTETFKALSREGVELEKLTGHHIIELFRLVASEKSPKEAIPEIATWLTKHQNTKPEDAAKELGLVMVAEEDLESFINKLVKDRGQLIEEKGGQAFGILMGVVMKEFRGKVQPETVTRIIKNKLKLRS